MIKFPIMVEIALLFIVATDLLLLLLIALGVLR